MRRSIPTIVALALSLSLTLVAAADELTCTGICESDDFYACCDVDEERCNNWGQCAPTCLDLIFPIPTDSLALNGCTVGVNQTDFVIAGVSGPGTFACRGGNATITGHFQAGLSIEMPTLVTLLLDATIDECDHRIGTISAPGRRLDFVGACSVGQTAIVTCDCAEAHYFGSVTYDRSCNYGAGDVTLESGADAAIATGPASVTIAAATFTVQPGALYRKSGGAGTGFNNAYFINEGEVENLLGLRLQFRDGQASTGTFRLGNGSRTTFREYAFLPPGPVFEHVGTPDFVEIQVSLVNHADVDSRDWNVSGTYRGEPGSVLTLEALDLSASGVLEGVGDVIVTTFRLPDPGVKETRLTVEAGGFEQNDGTLRFDAGGQLLVSGPSTISAASDGMIFAGGGGCIEFGGPVTVNGDQTWSDFTSTSVVTVADEFDIPADSELTCGVVFDTTDQSHVRIAGSLTATGGTARGLWTVEEGGEYEIVRFDATPMEMVDLTLEVNGNMYGRPFQTDALRMADCQVSVGTAGTVVFDADDTTEVIATTVTNSGLWQHINADVVYTNVEFDQTGGGSYRVNGNSVVLWSGVWSWTGGTYAGTGEIRTEGTGVVRDATIDTLFTVSDGVVVLHDSATTADGTICVEPFAQLEVVGIIENEGIILVQDHGTIVVPVGAAASFLGSGTVRLCGPNAQIIGADEVSKLTNGAEHTIAGEGLIRIGVYEGFGTMRADKINPLRLDSSADFFFSAWVSFGILEAIEAGTIQINCYSTDLFTITSRDGAQGLLRALSGGSIIVAGDGDLRAEDAFLTALNGGTIALDIGLETGSAVDLASINGGSLTLRTHDYRIRRLAAAEDAMLHIAAMAEMDSMEFDNAAFMMESHPQPGSEPAVLSIARDISFNHVDESRWTLADGSVWSLDGGAGIVRGDWQNWTRMEIGGQDLGTDPDNHVGAPAGFDMNFDLPVLRIGPGAHAVLEDLVDNGNRGGGDEAIYVDTLEFSDADGRLNLNGLHLYFQTFVGDLAQIIDVPVDCTGDIDGTGDVAFGDILSILAAWGPCGGCHQDLDGDGQVGFSDLIIILSAWGPCV